ncbi:unnamed protein product [Strongylus vulgaris]|uniref:Carboxylesterase type B domain-containing protein n=1 Tax=Strongylus vulgaris TaxID=40348 RepID=A0A3P7JBY9_STRVU|nr:unnamed protein product [Strongylus vulgaris]
MLWIVLPLSAQILELKPGKVLGFDYETKKGDIAEVFLNIPYASPPVNELRFEKTKPIEPWKDIRNGTTLGPACPPVLPGVGYGVAPTSEDCLTLNIIRPKKKVFLARLLHRSVKFHVQPPPSGFAVLFYIHGGGYQFGSAHDYGYTGFADIYTPQDVIVVIIQYRLGVYGNTLCC